MKYSDLRAAMDIIKEYCEQKKLNFVIVGSVAYRDNKFIEKCDDLDCIIIYDDITKLESFRYINSNLYNASTEALINKKIDLFATKFELNNVQISLDLISVKYFERLAKNGPKGKSEFLRKMTDAEEYPTNNYIDFNGETYIYEKRRTKLENLNVYSLPKFIYINEIFYSGVLYNKFLHCPRFEVLENQEVVELHKILIGNYAEFYKSQKALDDNIDILKSIRNWDDFSEESKEFIKLSFNQQVTC